MPAPSAAVAELVAEAGRHYAAGHRVEAERSCRDALRLDPTQPQALHLLGIMAGETGQLTTAVALLSRALAREPDNAELHQSLGETYRHMGDIERALASLKTALRLRPDLLDAYRSAADAAKAGAEIAARLGQGDTAEELHRIAALYLYELSRRHVARGRFEQAEPVLREAAVLSPSDPDILGDLGAALQMLGRPSEAEAPLRRALALAPGRAKSHFALSLALLDLGRFDEAEAEAARAHAIDPELDALGHRLLHMSYGPDLDMERLLWAHRDWGAAAALGRSTPVFANARAPERRLKLGYVSPDLRRHSVSFFIEPLLRSHDPAQVESFCYAQVAAPDAVTERLRGVAHHWRSTVDLSDEDLRRQVREDGIDLLIDLAGHTGDSRLLAFAEKPAPVTATWLGYPTTTGLPTIDYRITDALADPPGETERFHIERLIRLPRCFLCYQPPDPSLPVAALPALAAGRVTFGCFNNLNKVSPAVVAVWARLLRQVPGSRLVLKAHLLNDDGLRRRYADLFKAAGIDPERLELRPRTPSTAEHLSAYNGIDIALDPFPYNGTATTCEALWMGVPVVSLVGRHHAGRVGLTLLANAGLSHLAAPDEEGYLRRAVTLAEDLARLAECRRVMRDRLLASPLCDAERFARDFEAALRLMWRRWCSASS